MLGKYKLGDSEHEKKNVNCLCKRSRKRSQFMQTFPLSYVLDTDY